MVPQTGLSFTLGRPASGLAARLTRSSAFGGHHARSLRRRRENPVLRNEKI